MGKDRRDRVEQSEYSDPGRAPGIGSEDRPSGEDDRGRRGDASAHTGSPHDERPLKAAASFRTPADDRKQLTISLEGNRGIVFKAYHDEYGEYQTLSDLMSFIETSFLPPGQQVTAMEWVREESTKTLAPSHRIHDLPHKTNLRARIPDPYPEPARSSREEKRIAKKNELLAALRHIGEESMQEQIERNLQPECRSPDETSKRPSPTAMPVPTSEPSLAPLPGPVDTPTSSAGEPDEVYKGAKPKAAARAAAGAEGAAAKQLQQERQQNQQVQRECKRTRRRSPQHASDWDDLTSCSRVLL